MKLKALTTVLLLAMAQPLSAQKLGLFMQELEKESKQAERIILKYCKIPANLKQFIGSKNTSALTNIANKWIYDCRRTLKVNRVSNKTTDFYLDLAKSLIPEIKNMTNKDLDRYGDVLLKFCRYKEIICSKNKD